MQGLAGLPLPAALGQYILNDFVLFVGITNIGMLAGYKGSTGQSQVRSGISPDLFFQNPDCPDYSGRALLDMFWMK